MWWTTLITPILGLAQAEFGSSQNRKVLRRVIRQRILAPVLHLLEDPTVRRSTAVAIVHAAYGVRSVNLIGAIVLKILTETILHEKIVMVDDVFLKPLADELANPDIIEVIEDDEELTFRIKKGRDAVKKLVRDILGIL